MAQYALGLDFGTSSIRALIVDCADGREVSCGVSNYRHGVEGVLVDPSDPDLARQNPADYIVGIIEAVRLSLENAGPSFNPDQICGIGIDTTGSTPLATNGLPLGMQEGFEGNLDAMAWLWKDHSSHAEAEEITDLARRQGRPYLAKCGGSYSSEWFWAKALRAIRNDPSLFDDPEVTWMELCDSIPLQMCASSPVGFRRSICAAGHKAMYSEEWGGLPDREFLSQLDPRLGELRDRLYDKAYTSDQLAGVLHPGNAKTLGLPPEVPVAVGLLDAHAGAVGSGVARGRMVKILGTSTCDILVGGPDTPDIEGVSGIVSGSVIPGMSGIEAGQSAVGDLFAWWTRVSGRSQNDLAADAGRLRPGQSGLLALDWNNGNRNVLADPLLRGLVVGQTLHTTAAEIYRALIEATAFGALKIIRRIEESGVAIEDLVACGGIAEKSPLVMQIYADVLNRPIRLSRCSQAPALGSAVFGAVVGGAHPDVPTAQAAMTGFKDLVYQPEPASAEAYRRLFVLYEALHDAFGTPGESDLSHVMKQLGALRKP